jgi:hypothetical protein
VFDPPDDLGLTRIFVALDCKGVVSDCHEEGFGKNGSIVKEIRARASQFQEFKLVFEGRASNHEAHNLARYAYIGRHVWLVNPYDISIPVNIVINQ